MKGERCFYMNYNGKRTQWPECKTVIIPAETTKLARGRNITRQDRNANEMHTAFLDE